MFTGVAVLMLALGIGANTAMFSVVDALLLKSLPVRDPGRLVLFGSASAAGISIGFPEESAQLFSNRFYREACDRNQSFSSIAAVHSFPLRVHGIVDGGIVDVGGGDLEPITTQLVSGNYFEVLGVNAVRGRVLTPSDDVAPGGHPIAVITYDCWQKRFAGDPQVIGKTVIVNGRNFTIIGVAPQGFYGSEIIYRPEIWFPTMMQAQIDGWSTLERRGESTFFVQGRLKPGVTMSQAEAELKAIAAQLAREFPNENEGMSVTLSPAGA